MDEALSMLLTGTPVMGGGEWSITIDSFTQSLGSELITNGNMETGDPPTGWLAGANATLSSAADERTGGGGAASLNVLESSDGSNNYGQYNLTGLTALKWYLGSLWIKNVDETLGCYLQWTDNTNNAMPPSPYWATASWEQVYFLRQLPAGRTTAFFRGRGSGDNGQNFRCDDASTKNVVLNTGFTAASPNMQVECDFTLPAGGVINSQVNLYYRFTDTLETTAQFWRAQVVRNEANTEWDCTLYLVNGTTETQKLKVDDVGTPDGLKVVVIGNEHRIYTRASSTWTQRGSAVTDASYNDQRGVNVINTPDITVTALRGSAPSPF